jgi:hypothetical protein
VSSPTSLPSTPRSRWAQNGSDVLIHQYYCCGFQLLCLAC